METFSDIVDVIIVLALLSLIMPGLVEFLVSLFVLFCVVTICVSIIEAVIEGLEWLVGSVFSRRQQA